MIKLNIFTIYLILIISNQEIHSNEYPFYSFKNQSQNCNETKLCEYCGVNSEKCHFDSTKCFIKCECKIGYSGMYCNETTIISSSFDENSPKYKFVDEFVYLKDMAWNDILNTLNGKDFSRDNMDTFEKAIHKLKRIFEILYFEAKIDSSDSLKYKKVLENIFKQNTNNFFLSDKLLEQLYYVMDNIIYLNYFISSVDRPSIFNELNVKHNNSALHLFSYFENLAKYLRFEDQTYKKYLKYNNFETSIINFPNSGQNKPEFRMTAPKDLNQKLLLINVSKKNYLDSISLNEYVLKKLYGNQTIKISFNIFFNQNNINIKSKEILSEEEMLFYQQVHSKLARNFIYEITSSVISNEITNKVLANSYFVSSNIISAKIHNQLSNYQEKLEKIPKEELDKYVRVQFLINLNQFHINANEQTLKNKLICVFWNESSSKWSSNGCKKSIKESHLVEEDYDNNFYIQVCYCNHLTNFALLFDPLGKSIFYNDFYDEEYQSFLDLTVIFMYQYVLNYLTLIGIIVSSICYLILIILRLDFIKNYFLDSISNIKTNRDSYTASSTPKISAFFSTSSSSLRSSVALSKNRFKDETLRRLYLSNSICLLISNVLFFVNFIFKPQIRRSFRRFNASLLHYFILVSFCFSLGIAWQHFNKLVRIFNQHKINQKRFFLLNESNFYSKCLLISLFLPAMFTLYGYYSLFLFEDGFYWFKPPYLYYLFAAPLFTLLFISLVFYIFVSIKVVSIYQNNKMSSRLVTVLSNSSYNQKKVIVLLTFSFVTLGLTWILGIFVIITSYFESNKILKLLADFLFCLFNSFHGLSLLIGNYLARKYSKSDNIRQHNFGLKSILKNNISNNKTINKNESDKSNILICVYMAFHRLISFLKKSDIEENELSGNKRENNVEFSIYSQVKPKKNCSFESNKNKLEKDQDTIGNKMSSCENILSQIDQDIIKYIENHKNNLNFLNMDDAFTSSV